MFAEICIHLYRMTFGHIDLHGFTQICLAFHWCPLICMDLQCNGRRRTASDTTLADSRFSFFSRYLNRSCHAACGVALQHKKSCHAVLHATIDMAVCSCRCSCICPCPCRCRCLLLSGHGLSGLGRMLQRLLLLHPGAFGHTLYSNKLGAAHRELS